MAVGGWRINLSGENIPVYEEVYGSTGSNQVGTIQKNECFAEGTVMGSTGYEGDGVPVEFINADHEMTWGACEEYFDYGDFADYASNGASWEEVDTLERVVKYTTYAYYADGSRCCKLVAGSRVWLTRNCTKGASKPNYVAVTAVETAAGKKYNFSGNGFVDLIYGGKWLRPNNILLRKA